MIKRFIDILFSLLGILLLSPFLLLIALLIRLGSPGGVFFRQTRIGKDARPFTVLKFRTMHPGAELGGQLSMGEADPRVSATGRWLRRYKLDELPQLFNVLMGDMSIVGPRPEVPRYVAFYGERYQAVLSVRPGITDYASLQFINEGALLSDSPDPEKTYLEEILPRKLDLALTYVNKPGIGKDFHIMFLTLLRILRAG